MDAEKTEQSFRIDRGKYEEVFSLLVKKVNSKDPERCYFNNNTFSLFPFAWGCDCPGSHDYPEGEHNEECAHKKPNFLYKPTGYELNWYKYPLRGAEENKKTQIYEFMDMINHCIQSLN